MMQMPNMLKIIVNASMNFPDIFVMCIFKMENDMRRRRLIMEGEKKKAMWVILLKSQLSPVQR